MKRTVLYAAIAAGFGVFIAPTGPAHAQSEDEESSSFVEEIVVTARRREESLQDVPGTVTALSQQTLESAGVERAEDFLRLTPGVSLVDAAEVGDTQVNIRGINGARDAENSFAFILDGVLYTNPAAFNREYTDLQQIEVFKGPQGAIYGRNAAAGAIIVTTEKPTNETSANALISLAQDDTYLFKGGIGGALIQDEL
ncbi:MAG: Plug domain-containing protein, partial [Xanthomonadales bacterium]|nr:Plug domain-containing protein [Xanthomonadales bacterium]